MSDMILKINEDGTVEEYKEPYITIECKTEEDYKRLEYLLNLGKATEKAYNSTAFLVFEDTLESDINGEIFGTIEELLEWAENEEK